MNGDIDLSGQSILFLKKSFTPRLSFSTNDATFIASVASQVDDVSGFYSTKGIGLSEKQAAVALILISKYAAQLEKNGVEQPNHRNFKYPPRKINHERSLRVDDGAMQLRFPFNSDLIQTIREFAKSAQGEVVWNHEEKYWKFGLTEYNVSWAVAFAQSHSIDISDDVIELFNQILEVEKTPYGFELKLDDSGKVIITNAPESMTEYLAAHEVDQNDVVKMADYAGELAYELSDDVREALTSAYGKAFVSLCELRKFDKEQPGNTTFIDLDSIISWAIEVGRLPIVIYNPNLSRHDVTAQNKYFTPDEIQIIKSGGKSLDKTAKLVYTTKSLEVAENEISVLISYANLLHGTNKRKMLDAARKIVYYCERLPVRY